MESGSAQARGRARGAILVVGATGQLRHSDRTRPPRSRRSLFFHRARRGKAARRLSRSSAERTGPPRSIAADLTDADVAGRIAGGPAPRPAASTACLRAGPFPRTPFAEVRREDFERALAVHAVAPLLLVQALAPDLSRARGAVVGLGDAGTSRPFGNHIAYLTAKGAVQTGLRALAVELAPDVRVNLVEIGIVSDPEAIRDPRGPIGSRPGRSSVASAPRKRSSTWFCRSSTRHGRPGSLGSWTL